jgi:hypothetical protein
MNDLLVSNAIQNRYGLLENTLCCGFVASFDRLTNTLNRGTEGRTQAGVVGTLPVSLTGALASLSAIGHKFISKNKTEDANYTNTSSIQQPEIRITPYRRHAFSFAEYGFPNS